MNNDVFNDLAFSKRLPFPAECLPPIIADYVKQMSTAVQCPIDYLGMSVLVAASTAFGLTRKIELRPNWAEGGSLYIGLVGDPGTNKSTPIATTMKPVEAINNQNKEMYDKELDIYNAQKEIREQEIIDQKKKAKSKQGEITSLPDKPHWEELVAGNITVEALYHLFEYNRRGAVMCRDELNGFFTSRGQYKGGRGDDKEFFLSLWQNKVEPKKRADKNVTTLHIPHGALLNIIGGITPDVVSQLFKGAPESGEKDRFIFIHAEEIKAILMDYTNLPRVDRECQDAYEKLINDLYYNVKFENGQSRLVTLSNEASALFEYWAYRLHELAQHAKTPIFMRGVYMKQRSYIGRIALIIHMMRFYCGEVGVEEDVVDAVSMNAAVSFVMYFKSHADYIHGGMNVIQPDELRFRTVRRIQDKGDRYEDKALGFRGKIVTVRDLYKGMGLSKEAIERILEQLSNEGYGRTIVETHKDMRNRSRSTVNFILFDEEWLANSEIASTLE